MSDPYVMMVMAIVATVSVYSKFLYSSDDDHDDGIDGDNYGAKNNVDKMSTCSHRFEGYRDIT